MRMSTGMYRRTGIQKPPIQYLTGRLAGVVVAMMLLMLLTSTAAFAGDTPQVVFLWPKGAATLPGFRTFTFTNTFCGEFDTPLDVTDTLACRLLGFVNPALRTLTVNDPGPVPDAGLTVTKL